MGLVAPKRPNWGPVCTDLPEAKSFLTAKNHATISLSIQGGLQMKKLLLIVFSGFFSIVFCDVGFAAFLSDAPAPTQSYQAAPASQPAQATSATASAAMPQATAPAPKSASAQPQAEVAAPANSTDEAAAVAQVQAIMQRSKAIQEAKRNAEASGNADHASVNSAPASTVSAAPKAVVQAPVQAQAPAQIQANTAPSAGPVVVAPTMQTATITPAVPAVNDNAGNGNNVNDAAVQEQVNTLSQTNLMYQQRMAQQIETLSQQDQMLQDKIDRLGKAILILNSQVVAMQKMESSIPSGNSASAQLSSVNEPADSWAQRIEERYGNSLMYAFFIAVLAIVILTSLLVFRNRRTDVKVVTATSSDYDQTEGEYDFLNSNEGIAAKLDLARAYIEMDDYAQARAVLDEIQQKGKDDQKVEARELLKKIDGND